MYVYRLYAGRNLCERNYLQELNLKYAEKLSIKV
jgi:hypothetical protein